ncbi:hypothetical protein [Micromonospora sp. WMMD1082]|uniref:hypothetical protein n=1 Tax=Micromonospora sp. WMMD1082 TaxID=3016104 RepID=UPI0024179BFE|nr:hypothetical protein [Micromonospora sp. WMMD1082]MDG4796491.1 hypothetical protein [Micromonospora sp. WMMD1082]
MAATDPGSAREEAERLVATLLASVRLAAANPAAAPLGPLGGIVTGVLGHSGGPSGPSGPPGATGGGFATGAAECCVCPVCRGIAALRDPSPEFAERLATGAGDLAAGLASFLRAFTPADPAAGPSPAPADGTAAGTDSDHVWREATRTGHDSQPAPERDVWSAATRAEDVAVPAAAPADAAGRPAPALRRPSTDRPAVPASRVPDGEPAPGDEPAPGGRAVPGGERQGAPGDGA